MVQLSSPAVKSPKTSKMGKTPKKSSAIDTPAKTVVMTPKQAKNTPAKTEVKTPKQAKNTPAKTEAKTPKQAKNTPAKAALQTPSNGTASAKKSKKAKTPKQQKPAEDVEMASEGEEEAAPAQPSPKKSPKKEAVNVDEGAEMSSEEEEIVVKPKSKKSAAHKKDNDTHEKVKNGIFIRGLNYNTTEGAVSEHFSQFGSVRKCSVPKNRDKKALNKGFCFIEFETKEAVDKALAAAHTLDSRTLEVKENDEAAGKRKREESEQRGNAPKRQRSTSDKELFVARLGFATTKDTIEEYFSKFGEVVNVGLPMKSTKENKGFAFISFKEPSSLTKALAEKDPEIESSKIVLRPSEKTVKEDRPKLSHPNELFVGGLAPVTQKHILEEHFSKYGKVANVTLPWNINKRMNKGFGFVSFESAESLGLALEEDHEIDGKKIGVKAAHSNSTENTTDSKKAETKKVKAAPAKVEVEDDDEEMEGEEADSDDDEAENEDAEGEDEDAEGEDEDAEGEDEEAEGEDEEAEGEDEEAEGEHEEAEGEDEEAEGEDEEAEGEDEEEAEESGDDDDEEDDDEDDE